jgi:hypothetical protein
MPSSAGITLSRVCAIPASMDEGCPWMVVLRAYMICLLCVGQRLDGAAVHFIVLPQARRGNGTPAKNAPANKTAKDAPAKKTAAKK